MADLPEKTQALLDGFVLQQRETYWKNSDELMRTYNAYDKTVLTLSTGAIGVTLYYLQNGHFVSRWAIWSAVLAFTSSIVCILVSYLYGIMSFKETMKDAQDKAELKQVERGAKMSRLSRIADRCNLASGAGFLIGLVFIIIVVFQTDQPENHKMPEKPKIILTKVAESAVAHFSNSEVNESASAFSRAEKSASSQSGERSALSSGPAPGTSLGQVLDALASAEVAPVTPVATVAVAASTPTGADQAGAAPTS